MNILRLFPPERAAAPPPAPRAGDAALPDLVIARFIELLSRLAPPPRGGAPMAGPVAREKMR